MDGAPSFAYIAFSTTLSRYRNGIATAWNAAALLATPCNNTCPHNVSKHLFANAKLAARATALTCGGGRTCGVHNTSSLLV